MDDISSLILLIKILLLLKIKLYLFNLIYDEMYSDEHMNIGFTFSLNATFNV